MIPTGKIEKIVRMLNQAHSYRCIAKACNVARGTVAAIATGKIKLRERVIAELDYYRQGPIARCKRCGRMIRQPCLPCRLVQIRELPKMNFPKQQP